MTFLFKYISFSSRTDSYIPSQHSNMNPFTQAPVFSHSGPHSFIDFHPCEVDYYAQSSYDQPPPPPSKTPIRTPVMGTRTYQHRRTLSNASSQYSSRGVQVDYSEVNPAELDYRFNSFNISGAIEREPLQFHSVPYSCNHSDNTNVHPVPDRMRLYENLSHFQHQLKDSPSGSLNASHNQIPIKTTYIETTAQNQDFMKTTAMANSIRGEMFLNNESNPQNTTNELDDHQTNETITGTFSTTKISGSTGCTPTHSTPQDSFSDDSSYLSALSSQNRVRFSPDNFLTDVNAFSPTSRIAVANLQRAIVRRTLELEEGEKS